MVKFLKKLVALVLIISSIVVISAIAIIKFWDKIPYQSFVETKIKEEAEKLGVEITNIDIKKINSNSSKIKNLKIGGESNFKIAEITAEYEWNKAIKGEIENVSISSVNLNLVEENKKWQVKGLENLGKEGNSKKEEDESLNLHKYEKYIPNLVEIKDSNISVKSNEFDTKIPFNLTLNKEDNLILNLISSGFNLKADKNELQLNNIKINSDINLRENKIDADFSIKQIIPKIDDLEIPDLDLTGGIQTNNENLVTKFKLASKNEGYLLEGVLRSGIDDFQNAKLDVKKAQFKWGGGSLSIENQSFDLNPKKPHKLIVRIIDVGVADLMTLISKGNVGGTGKISGDIPIMIYPDGHITLQTGFAEALGGGKVTVSPALLPGDNAQIKIARDTLQNFNYTKMKILVSSEGEKGREKSSIQLSVNGSNPDANNGREVILNVNIAGDVIPLIQQSLIPFNNLRKLIDIN